MKAKVKGSKKDINIDINIENNLMSKNKTISQDSEPEVPKPQNKLNTKLHKYNPELPRMVNDYYGIMASKQLYDITSSRPTPLNLNQYFPSTVSGQPQNPIHQPGHTLQFSPIGHTPGNEDGEENTDIFEDSHEQPVDENVSLNELNIPHIGFLNGRMTLKKFKPEDITIDMIKNSVLNAEQEAYMQQSIHQSEKTNRTTIINRVKNRNRVHPKSIVKYNLGQYVKDFYPEYWSELTGAV